jgi:hypothetical protein
MKITGSHPSEALTLKGLTYFLFTLTANWFLPGGSGTTITHHAQTKQHTKLHQQ